MLPKKNRLSRFEIEDIKKQQKSLLTLQGTYFGLVFQKNDLSGKFGVIVSNKVLNKATQRNKVKRLLYKIIEKKWTNKAGKFLFLAKRNCSNCTLDDIEKELNIFEKRL